MVSLSIIYSCCASTLLPSLFHHCRMYKEYHVFSRRIWQFFATLGKIGNSIIFKSSIWRFTFLAAVFSNFLNVQFSLLSIFYVIKCYISNVLFQNERFCYTFDKDVFYYFSGFFFEKSLLKLHFFK